MFSRNVRIFKMLVIILLVSGTFTPALADKPVHTKVVFDADYIYSGCGFDIPVHQDGKYIRIYYFDRYGGDRADSYHWGGSSASMTYNGHTLTLRDSENSRTDWVTWNDAIVTVRGVTWIGNIPGSGVVFGTVGKQEILESCHEEGADWVCNYTLLHLSGMVFDNQVAVCNYMLNGK